MKQNRLIDANLYWNGVGCCSMMLNVQSCLIQQHWFPLGLGCWICMFQFRSNHFEKAKKKKTCMESQLVNYPVYSIHESDHFPNSKNSFQSYLFRHKYAVYTVTSANYNLPLKMLCVCPEMKMFVEKFFFQIQMLSKKWLKHWIHTEYQWISMHMNECIFIIIHIIDKYTIYTQTMVGLVGRM